MGQPRRGDIVLLIGTRKGGLLLCSDKRRRKWEVGSLFFKGWAVHNMILDPRHGRRIFGAVNSDWWGSDVRSSTNWGKTWRHSREGVRYAPDSGLSVKRVWSVAPGPVSQPRVVYAGVEPAGLFRSDDGGLHWAEVAALNRHSSREKWTPGGGGLILHTIAVHSHDERRIYVAISAAGFFRSDDAGASWNPMNRGLRADFLPDKFPEVGQCVHKFAAHPSRPNLLYQQNHCGVYRSDSAGDRWTDISRGLPSRFGFAMALDPHDPQVMYVLPEEGPDFRCTVDGKLRVYRTRNGGKSWQPLSRGLPQKHAYANVLRDAMASDSCEPCGVYFGTQGGQVFLSRDRGEHWELLLDCLPPVLSVSCGEAA